MELIKTAEPYNQAPALRARLVRLSDANIERTTAASLRSATQPTHRGGATRRRLQSVGRNSIDAEMLRQW